MFNSFKKFLSFSPKASIEIGIRKSMASLDLMSLVIDCYKEVLKQEETRDIIEESINKVYKNKKLMIAISVVINELPKVIEELKPSVEKLSEIIFTECKKREEEGTELLNVLFEE